MVRPILILLLTSIALPGKAQTPAGGVVSYLPGSHPVPTVPHHALGAPDQVGVPLGDGGTLALAFESSFLDGAGTDITVFPRNEDADSLAVAVSNDGQTYTDLGTALSTGDTPVSFDLSGSGVTEARFVRLTDLAGGGVDGFIVDAVRVEHPAAPPAGSATLTGFVLFPDQSTPADRASVQLYQGSDLVACDNVDSTGQYRINAPPGQYQVVVVYPVPAGFSVPDGTLQVFHPADNDTAVDVTVAAGVASPATLDIRFNWPVLLIHGLLFPGHVNGTFHFSHIQPYLASDLETALQQPRPAFLPVTPIMSQQGRRSYVQFFRSLSEQGAELLSHLGSRFSILGFSQGGLVARRIVSFLEGTGIEKVILIATPNRGTCVAEPGVCEYCSAYDYFCPLAPSAVEQFNLENPSGYDVPFYLVAGSYAPDACHCLAGVENDGMIPVDSVLYLDSTLFPGNGLDYQVVDHGVFGAELVPPTGIHHYRLRRQPEILALLHRWLTDEGD